LLLQLEPGEVDADRAAAFTKCVRAEESPRRAAPVVAATDADADVDTGTGADATADEAGGGEDGPGT
jgi:hypothetical protein